MLPHPFPLDQFIMSHKRMCMTEHASLALIFDSIMQVVDWRTGAVYSVHVNNWKDLLQHLIYMFPTSVAVTMFLALSIVLVLGFWGFNLSNVLQVTWKPIRCLSRAIAIGHNGHCVHTNRESVFTQIGNLSNCG